MSHRDDPRNGTQHTPADTTSPSDEWLIEYLLGHSSAEQRGTIEHWLLCDPANGDHLCAIATGLVELSEAFGNPQATGILQATSSSASAPCAKPIADLSPSHATARHVSPGSMRRLVWFAIAASLFGVIVSLYGLKTNDTEPELAMAWVETLASGNELDEPQSLSTWPSEILATDELGGLELDVEIDSQEPPDWLLAAVLDMHDESQTTESLEAVP
jgi:hypothetical protein